MSEISSYKIYPQADRDLDGIADYLLEKAGIDVALQFLAAADEVFGLLATQPDMGWRPKVKHPSLRDVRVFRVTGFERILVFYRTAGDRSVAIVRVLHGSRDLDSLLARQGLP